MKNPKLIASVLALTTALAVGLTVPSRAYAAEGSADVTDVGSSAAAPVSKGTTHHVKKGTPTNGKKHIVGRGAHAPQAHHVKKHTAKHGSATGATAAPAPSKQE